MAIYQNDPEIMRKHLRDVIAFEGDSIFGKIGQGLMLHLDGKTAEGLKILREQEVKINKLKYFDGEIIYHLVLALAFLGDKEATIRTFKKAVENGFFAIRFSCAIRF